MIRNLLSIWTVALLAASASAVPPTMYFQGTLEDPAGQPLTIDAPGVTVFVEIYADAAGTNKVWGNRFDSVTVTKGAFAVLLGTGVGFPDSQLTLAAFNGDRWIGLAVSDDTVLDPAERLWPTIPLASVPYAMQSDGGTGASVPIGTVIDYYLDPAANPLPDGWEICDGQPVTDPASPIHGMIKPDFTMPRFVRGTSNPNGIGTTGGSNTAATDAFTGPSAGASVTTTGSSSMTDTGTSSIVNTGGSSTASTDSRLGSHNHMWAVTQSDPVGGTRWDTFNAAGIPAHIATWNQLVQLANPGFPMMQANVTNVDFHTDMANLAHVHDMAHTHGMAHTHNMGHTHNTEHNHNMTHSHTLTVPEPPFVGMLKIIRVK